jgi:hypothetical protein
VTRRLALLAALLLIASLAGSCAVPDATNQGSAPGIASPPPQAAARIGLPLPYRAFYDELEDDGDWVDIEPYGWVFRPRVNFVAWRPYQDGWWEPSDTFGWIWNSNEPFGWITYHYGEWFYDSFQGWVWQPGPVWGPAWVAWVQVDDYVGWAPLAPQQYSDFDRVPGGLFTYVGATQFTSRDVSQSALFVRRLPPAHGRVQEVLNISRVNGIPFNRGPDAAMLARMGSSIPQSIDAETLPRVRLTSTTTRFTADELVARTQRVLQAGRVEMTSAAGGGPPLLPLPAPPPARKPAARPVAADSAAAKHAPADSTAKRPAPKRPPHRAAARDSLRER